MKRNKVLDDEQGLIKELNTISKEENDDDPSFPKDEPFYCCVCKKNTNGLSTCWICNHHKGRWKTDKHHCIGMEER